MFLFMSGNSSLVRLLLQIFAVLSALFIAMPFHEFAHAFAAKHEGDFTAVAHKRYTLAPLAHIDKVGFIFLFLFGFGWAKPVPVEPRNFKRGRLSSFLVSVAGIVTNMVLGIFFLFIYFLILKLFPNFYASGVIGEVYKTFLSASIIMNFSLAFFNLLPIYPLDGYRICASFSKYDNTFLAFLRRYSVFIYIILMITGVYSIVFNTVMGSLIEGLRQLFITILRI